MALCGGAGGGLSCLDDGEIPETTVKTSSSGAVFIMKSSSGIRDKGKGQVDEDTLHDSSMHADAASHFTTSNRSSSIAATEEAVGSSLGGTAASAATTVQMGTGENSRTRRPSKKMVRHSPDSRQLPSETDGGGPVWKQATEESHLRCFSIRSERSSHSPHPKSGAQPNRSKTPELVEEPNTENSGKHQTAGARPAENGEAQQEATYRFEFGDVVEKNARRRGDREGSSRGSVYSFSYSQDEDGSGFELDDFQQVLEGGSLTHPLKADSRDESLETTSTIEKDGAVNMSDRDLMERSTSPGALRLTEEGLSRHEKDTFRETLKAQPADPFQAWKNDHDARKRYRQRHPEKQELPPDTEERQRETQRRLDHFIKVGEGGQPPLPVSKPSKRPESKSNRAGGLLIIPPFVKKASEDNSVGSSKPPSTTDRNDRSKIGKMFRRRSSRSAASSVCSEREDPVETRKQDSRRQRQKEEKERIEMKRRAYLSSQRAREGIQAAFSANESVRSADTSIQSRSSALPPCVVCHRAERTHIATPCMHFSFCAACAIRLGKQNQCHCPVCFEPDVKYASVSV